MLFIRALLLALIITVPQLYCLSKYSGLSILSYGADDAFYLTQSIKFAQLTPQRWYYLEANALTSWSDILETQPYFISEYFVGKIALFFNLTPLELGIWLDFICLIVCFIFFSLSFRLWSPGKFTAELAALAMLFIPYAFMGGLPYLVLNLFSEKKFIYQYFVDYDLPSLRPVCTQVSYAVFSILLFWKTLLVKNKNYTFLPWFSLGTISGLTFFAYFFTWIFLNSLTFGYLVLLLASSCRKEDKPSRSHLARALVSFCTGSAITSIIGITLTAVHNQEGIVSDSQLSHYWFLSPFSLLMALLFLFLFQKKDTLRDGHDLLLFSATVLILENILPNIQPVIGKLIAPYHFVRFYTQPLFTGCLIIAGALLWKRIQAYLPNFRNFASLLLSLIVIILFSTYIAFETRRHSIRTSLADLEYEFKELAQYVTEKTSANFVVAIMSDNSPFRLESGDTFTLRNFPLAFASLTQRYILHQDWNYTKVVTNENILREKLLGWLFSGKAQLLWPCPQEVYLPGDIFNLTWSGYVLRRGYQCNKYAELIDDQNVCPLLKHFAVDAMLIENKATYGIKEPSTVIRPYLKEIFSSSRGAYTLYAFDRALALRSICNTKSGP